MERTEERNLVRLGMYIASGTLVSLFILFAGCTMHSNTFDADRAKGEAVKIKARAELEKAESRIEELRLEALERLIDKGINPIAARCAVKGWERTNDRETCERVSKNN